MIFLVLFAGAACALAGWLYWNYTTLSRRGLNHGPTIPLFGELAGVMMQKEHITDAFMRTYESFPDDRLVGGYDFLTPFVVLKDLELLKRITVKDFEHFLDRINTKAESDPLVDRILIHLKGGEWKNMRSALSPAFTTSKIRLMVPLMVQVGDWMMHALKTKIDDSRVDYIDLEAKDLMSRYANDIIATCIFGLDVNSQREGSQFYNMSKELTTVTLYMNLRLFGFKIIPGIMAWLKMRIFPMRLTEFFSNVVLGAMRQREEMNIHRPDMIHLLMEAKKGKLLYDTRNVKDEDAGFATVEEYEVGRTKNKTNWSDLDLVAQAVSFLFAGYDSISNTMSFLFYELAVNSDCQEKLVQEIRENEKRNNGKFDYSSVQRMPYLDMVVSEVLRKWPAEPVVSRLCVRDYNLGKPNEKATKDFIIRKGEAVQIPIWAYHRDPKHFPDPEKFDPERFSNENKHNIDPLAYMPFGSGPRNCIASRFALCEVKVMVYQVLLHMELSPCEKTNIPPRLSVKNGFRMSVTGGNWLRFRPRKEL